MSTDRLTAVLCERYSVDPDELARCQQAICRHAGQHANLQASKQADARAVWAAIGHVVAQHEGQAA